MNKFVADRLVNDYFQEDALSQDILKDVLKFHQSTNFLLTTDINTYPYNQEIFDWLQKVENQDVTPSNISKVLKLPKSSMKHKGSNRKFTKKVPLPLDVLGRILGESFGRSEDGSKKYSSAGALYPVIPILLVFSSDAVEGISEPGSYLFDSKGYRLICLERWDVEELNKVKNAIHPKGEILSNLSMAYAVDLKRAITKYRLRGYRHSLIETGLISQSFASSLIEEDKYNLGHCMWSAFNDNSLSKMIGMNIREAPVTIVQWFGIIEDSSND